MPSVVQPWVQELPLRMQSTMLLALRGPDGCPKYDHAKVLLRELRSAILVPAFPGQPDSFMGDQKGYVEDWRRAQSFLDDHDVYPHHWLMHFAHAAEIVGYCHQDDAISNFWRRVYFGICDAFHMSYESVSQMEKRLADQPPDAIERAARAVGYEVKRGHGGVGGY